MRGIKYRAVVGRSVPPHRDMGAQAGWRIPVYLIQKAPTSKGKLPPALGKRVAKRHFIY